MGIEQPAELGVLRVDRSRTFVPWMARNSIALMPCRVRTSICSTGSWEISSAKALMRIIEHSRDHRQEEEYGGAGFPAHVAPAACPWVESHTGWKPVPRTGLGRSLSPGCAGPIHSGLIITRHAETARHWWFRGGRMGRMESRAGPSITGRNDAGCSPMAMLIWPFLIYWLVLFVVCFVVVEFGHDQLYDEVTPHAGLKVAGGSLLLAILLTALRYYDRGPHRSSRCSPRTSSGPCCRRSSGRASSSCLPVPPLARPGAGPGDHAPGDRPGDHGSGQPDEAVRGHAGLAGDRAPPAGPAIRRPGAPPPAAEKAK